MHTYILLSYVLSLGVVAFNHFFLSPRNDFPNLVGFRAFFSESGPSKDSERRRGYTTNVLMYVITYIRTHTDIFA